MEEKESIKEPEFIPPIEEEKELTYEEEYEKNYHKTDESDIEEWGFE